MHVFVPSFQLFSFVVVFVVVLFGLFVAFTPSDVLPNS